MRRTLPVLTSALLALALTGCGSVVPEPEPTGSTGSDAGADTTTDSCAVAGENSDAVEVAGELGAEPEVSFATPMSTDALERTVVVAGDGDEVGHGDTVGLQFALYSGETGEKLTATDYTAPAESVMIDGLISGIVDSVVCSTVGTRVVGVVPPADAFGDVGNPQLGVQPGESVVFVIDVTDRIPAASEAMVPWSDDVPTVTRDADGMPTVVLPDTAPPTELKLAVLSEGDGPVVADGASVTVDYQGTSWDTGEIFDQSFGASPATFGTAQVVAGFGAALVGQKVGSTVVVTIPPIYAYGVDPARAQLGGQTLVFLIDIIDVAQG